MTIHLVYVKGNRISAPSAITNELVARLADKYSVKVYDWHEKITIQPSSGDILIGHPHPLPNTIYQNSFWQQGWKKRILMSPFSHAMPECVAFFDNLVVESDAYLAITGKYWIDTLEKSIVSHWQPWIKQLNLAVNTKNYPFIKNKFNPIGQRRFLYIGNTNPPKGCDYLSLIADFNPHIKIGWIGSGQMSSNKIKAHGQRNFSRNSSLKLVSNYDFILQCGRSDANPTTILEAAAWGLIPVCTPQSGYYNEDWVINIPLDDIESASNILKSLNNLGEDDLREYQRKARVALEKYYHWDRFAKDVMECIESPKITQIIIPNLSHLRTTNENRHQLKIIATDTMAKIESEKTIIFY
ncbi:MAG: glycosyltransferase [Calothrix sp. SM1_7_51]|nr:glycosyltransferase [Calothrix sp. SM1_7_51]